MNTEVKEMIRESEQKENSETAGKIKTLISLSGLQCNSFIAVPGNNDVFVIELEKK